MQRAIFAAVTAVVLISSQSSQAAPLCASATLTNYLVPAFECEVDGAVFSNFAFQLVNGNGQNVLETDDITVSPLMQGGRLGLRYAGNFTATGAPNGDGPAEGLRVNAYRFFFDVARDNSLFTDVAVGLNDPSRFAPNPLKFGGVLATNAAANDAALASVFDDTVGLFDATNLNSERATIEADALLQITGGASAVGTEEPVGFSSARSIDLLYGYRSIAVPAPASLSLLALGIGFIGLCNRRRSRVLSRS